MFFDRASVIRAIDRTARRVLSKFGAYVRQRAKTSIRKRKKISLPGHPPHSHTGLLRRFIFFGYDASRRSVVVGPVAFRRGTSTVPQILEYGGIVRRDGRRMRYRARPYMRPALQKEMPKLSSLWRDSIRP